MAIDTQNSGSIQAYQKLASLQSDSNIANTKANSNASPHKGIENAIENVTKHATIDSSQMTIRNERQASLVAHLFGDGQTAQENSLKLTFQAAIEKLNEVLMADMPKAVEGEAQTNLISEEALKEQGGMEYWTPENTAKRIVEGATAFMNGFQTAHPELEGESLINHFMDVVGGGLAQGFDEAKGILGDLDVLKGDIADNVESTFTLVQEGMQNFKNQFLGIETVENKENAPTANPELVE